MSLKKDIDPIEVLRPEYSMDAGYISTFYDLANIYTLVKEDANLTYNTSINIDSYISEVIVNTGEEYLEDETSLDEALEKIDSDLEIYLME